MTTVRVQMDLSFKCDNLAVADHLAMIRRAISSLNLPESAATFTEETIEVHQFDNLSL